MVSRYYAYIHKIVVSLSEFSLVIYSYLQDYKYLLNERKAICVFHPKQALQEVSLFLLLVLQLLLKFINLLNCYLQLFHCFLGFSRLFKELCGWPYQITNLLMFRRPQHIYSWYLPMFYGPWWFLFQCCSWKRVEKRKEHWGFFSEWGFYCHCTIFFVCCFTMSILK